MVEASIGGTISWLSENKVSRYVVQARPLSLNRAEAEIRRRMLHPVLIGRHRRDCSKIVVQHELHQ